jgi:hypothetical protein
MEVSGQLHTLAALPLGKELIVPIGQEAMLAPEPVWMWWREEKEISAPARNQTLVIQAVS